MTDLATRARATAEHAEVKFHARRDHSGSRASLLTLEVMTDDLPACARDAAPNQRFMLVLVPIADDGSPKAIPVKSRGEALRIKACVMCGDREFQTWCAVNCSQRPAGMSRVEHARGVILSRVGIKSRADLVTNSAACDRFEDLVEQFEASRGRRYFRSAT